MKLKNGLWLVALTCVLFACKKDEVDEPEVVYVTSEVLVNHPWLIESAIAYLGDSEMNLLESEFTFPECTLDNLIIFNEDFTVVTDDNIQLCEEDESAVLEISGVWEVLEDMGPNGEDLLEIQNEDDLYTLVVTDINDSRMVLAFDYYYADGAPAIPAEIVIVQE